MRKMLNQIISSARHQKAETTLGSYISRIQDTLHQAKEDKFDIDNFFLKLLPALVNVKVEIVLVYCMIFAFVMLKYFFSSVKIFSISLNYL